VGNVAVTGHSGGPYTVTFQGAKRGVNMEQITGNAAHLLGGAGRVVVHQAPSGRNEIQTISLAGPPKGGTFRLALGGEWTSPISYPASASRLQAELDRLPSIGAGNSTVVPGPVANSWSVEFHGRLSGTDQPLMLGDGRGLTGAITATTATVTNGVAPSDEVQRFEFGYHYPYRWQHATSSYGSYGYYNGFYGSYRFRYGPAGSSTISLPGYVSAWELRAALEALPEIGVGNVLVTSATPSSATYLSAYEIRFVHARGGRDIPRLELLAGDAGLGFGRMLEVAQGGQGGVNEIQTVSFNNGPTGGTFTLSFNGKTTAPSPLGAAAEEVYSALVAIGLADIRVQGLPSNWNPTSYRFIFVNSLGHKDVAPIRANAANLTGAHVTIATTQPASLKNDKQQITITGKPVGGTFTLTFRNQTTGEIPFNAAAAVVEAALNALATIGTEGVTVTGAVGGPYTVTFSPTQFAGQSLPLISANPAGLQGLVTYHSIGPKVTSFAHDPQPGAFATVAGVVRVDPHTTRMRVDFAYLEASGQRVHAGSVDVTEFSTSQNVTTGNFSFDPAQADASFHAPGHKVLMYRVTTFQEVENEGERQTGQTAWATFTFKIAADPSEGAPDFAHVRVLPQAPGGDVQRVVPSFPILAGDVVGNLGGALANHPAGSRIEL
jgi:hypothetical protein